MLAFSIENLTEHLFRVGFAQRIHADVLFPARSAETELFPMLNRPAGIFEQFHQSGKAVRLLLKHLIDRHAQLIPLGQLCFIAQPAIIIGIPRLGISDHGQLPLHADLVAEPCQSFP